MSKALTELAKRIKPVKTIDLPCLNCGTLHEFEEDSNEAQGIFNVFCPDKDCEDQYASKL